MKKKGESPAEQAQRALILHEAWRGKLEVKSKVKVATRDDLSMAYTPGVAKPCQEIARNREDVYRYTMKGNLIAVVTDGTAVLGLGDIGPEAALPVMEGKAVLFKEFGGVDAIPICIASKDVEEIIKVCKLIEPGIGGINLEDISAPRCFEIERRLKEELSIPVFHDDQHGTAIVVLAALINALKIVPKAKETLKVAISGAGAAGTSIADLLMTWGIRDVVLCNSKGILHPDDANLNTAQKELAERTNPRRIKGQLSDALRDADLFVGVSGPGIVSEAMVSSMAKDAIVFALANPVPEILPDLAKQAGAKVAGSGRSDYPNQINNVLAFPGIFKGALSCRKQISEPMKLAAAEAIAAMVPAEHLDVDYIVPAPFEPGIADAVAEAVRRAAEE